MRRLAAIAAVVMSADCTSLALHRSDVARERLSATELAIAETALRTKILGNRVQWPVVVLDETGRRDAPTGRRN